MDSAGRVTSVEQHLSSSSPFDVYYITVRVNSRRPSENCYKTNGKKTKKVKNTSRCSKSEKKSPTDVGLFYTS